jgi:hypothetical protein
MHWTPLAVLAAWPVDCTEASIPAHKRLLDSDFLFKKYVLSLSLQTIYFRRNWRNLRSNGGGAFHTVVWESAARHNLRHRVHTKAPRQKRQISRSNEIESIL